MKTKKQIEDRFNNLKYGACTDPENPNINEDIREATTLAWVLDLEPPEHW